jgi:AraC-like DNA-binding protein
MMVVKATLEKLDINPLHITLGEVTLKEKINKEKLRKLEPVLKEYGFELIDDHQSRIIEQIKTYIINSIHYNPPPDKKLSILLARHMHHDYSYLSNLFSQVEGITIEHYTIRQRIEKIKELLVYHQQSLSEIALELDYSSSAHLSAQFKKFTGFTPTQFRKMGAGWRNSLDDVGKDNQILVK